MPPTTFSAEEYTILLDDTFAKMRELSRLKGGEYAAAHDRLDNFRRNGLDCGVTMETCWRIYAGKHWDAISTYVRDLQTGTHRERLETIDGRVDDLMVYLMLFKCMIIERTRTGGTP
jgi:hypothetical protein